MQTNSSNNYHEETYIEVYKGTLYPTMDQKEKIDKIFDCVCEYWNRALKAKLYIYNENKDKPKSERLPIPKIFPSTLKEFLPFYAEVDPSALQNAYADLEHEFNRLLKGEVEYISMKSHDDQVKKYRTTNFNNSIVVDFENDEIKLPRLGRVKVYFKNTFKGLIKTATILKNQRNEYFVYVRVEKRRIVYTHQ
ncbi:MAG: transposase [Candidatus Aenigmatarchaeota archaeon]